VDEGIRLGVTVIPAFFMYDQLIVGSFLPRVLTNLRLAFVNYPTKGLSPSGACRLGRHGEWAV
jgi:hypothetical protein